MLLVGKFFEIMITREKERERTGYNITEVN